MSHKSNKNRTGKKISALKLVLVLGLGLFLLIFPKIAVGLTILEDFDSYNLGTLIDEIGNWQDVPFPAIVSDDQSVSAPHSAKYTFDFRNAYLNVSEGNRQLEFDVFFSDCSEPNHTQFSFNTATSTGSVSLGHFDAYSTTSDACEIRGYYFPAGYQVITSVATGTWNTFKFEQNSVGGLDYIKYSIGAITTDWLTANTTTRDIRQFLSYNNADLNFFLDDIKGGEGTCGQGDNCIFCSTQTSCENNGCYWIELPFPFVWVCSPFGPFIETATGTQFDFNIYYATTSQFATPTVFISGLAIATQPFLLILSSWLENFTELFDLAEAQSKGLQLGNAVPQARGYLDFFNSLFADLPLSEILLVYLIVLIGIIVFRIIRQIKKLIAI